MPDILIIETQQFTKENSGHQVIYFLMQETEWTKEVKWYCILDGDKWNEDK